MSNQAPESHTASYWAASSRHDERFAALDADLEADVAIIGGGFTGLSAAHHLQKQGSRCAILEANEIGWGASGRNGGMVVPRYKFTFPELERAYGRDTALEMYKLAHEAVDTLERIVQECRLDCGFGRYGHLTPILNPPDLRRFEADAVWLAEHAGDQAARMLDRREVAGRLGTDFYPGAYFEPRGGGIHPLEYCQSLASSLRGRGVGVFARTPVHSWSTDSQGVLLQAGSVRVRARRLIIATNGYTDLTAAGRPLRRRVVPVASALIATAPLPPALAAHILPQGNLATDAKRLTNYYRVMPDGRFLFGGRGGASNKASAGAYARLSRDMARIFPTLEGVAVAYRWFGLVAVTLDGLPHIGTLEPRVSYAMGYNGRGVALAALLGERLARLAFHEAVNLGPISGGRFVDIPFHSLRVPAKQVAITYMRLRDAIGL